VSSGLNMVALLFLVFAGAVLLAGLFLIYRGVRGVAVLSDPKCAKCGYDLRWVKPEVNVVCPECGSDLKAGRAIRFAEYQRKPRLILVGVGLIVAVVLLPAGLSMWMFATRVRAVPATPASRASLPTSSLITGLATTANQPWDWQELERRLTAGRLSKQETAAAIDQLIKHLKTKPGGWREPLPWSGQFVAAAEKSGSISDEQFGRLSQAFYGTQPAVTARGRLRQGQPLQFEVGYGSSWNLPGFKLIAALSRVKLDQGTELKVYDFLQSTSRPADPDQLSESGYMPIMGKVLMDMPPGRHTLTFEIDTGVVDESRPFKTGDSIRPGQTKRWPKTRYKWNSTVTIPIEAVPSDRPAVDLVTDEKLDPVKNGQLSITAKLFPRSERKAVLRLAIQQNGLGVSIASLVMVRVAGQEVCRGVFCVDTTSSRSCGDPSNEIARPSPGIRMIDVILTPSVEVAEKSTLCDRIWGQEMVFKNVPLQRADLEEGAESPASVPTVPSTPSRPH
jgi:hypothetical protein